MEDTMEQDYVRITYSKPENELTTAGRIARERLQAEIYSAIDTYHHVMALMDCPSPEAPIWISRSMRMPSHRVCLGRRSD